MDREKRLELESKYDASGELWSEVENGTITRENLAERAATLSTHLTGALPEEGPTPSAEEWRDYLQSLIEEHEASVGGG